MWAAFVVILWFRGIPSFELLIFGLIELLNAEFFPNLEFLRRALIASDAAAAGETLPKLCVERACPGLMLPFYRSGYCLEFTFLMWPGFRQVAWCDAWCVVSLKMHS